MKLDKIKSKKAIVEKALSNRFMSINVKAFMSKIHTVKDIKEACAFVKIEPIYKK